nr:hypothetical protein [uncultured Kingella sp.]
MPTHHQDKMDKIPIGSLSNADLIGLYQSLKFHQQEFIALFP